MTPVIPAQATLARFGRGESGLHEFRLLPQGQTWIPADAGMTRKQ
jgi:hypothetical protein